MVLLSTSEEWQRQSSLLLQARPTTTRISTKYNVPNLQSPKYQEKKRKRESGTEESEAAAAPKVPRAVLTLKTYDPESGVCLKFKTDRAADVGRLISGLGRLGRHMVALAEKTEDTIMEDVPAAREAVTQEQANPSVAANDAKVQQPVGGAGGKKKKKGKK